jgi:hypothetical protein
MEIVYHFVVVVMSLLIFFLRVTGSNTVFTFFLQFLGKVVPLFSMAYAVVQIFKYFSVL